MPRCNKHEFLYSPMGKCPKCQEEQPLDSAQSESSSAPKSKFGASPNVVSPSPFHLIKPQLKSSGSAFSIEPQKEQEKANKPKVNEFKLEKDLKPLSLAQHQPEPQAKLPLAPVKQVMEMNKSSAVPRDQMDEFIDGLLARKASLGFPLFTISDNNSFHTTGYLWGLYALKALKSSHGVKGPVAIINFDSHADGGKAGAELVASDRWGDLLVNSIQAEGYPACYLSVFNHPKGRGSHLSCLGGNGAQPSKPQMPEDLSKTDEVLKAFEGFYASMKAYFDNTAIKYVFFTIDRDVLRGSFTQWGDGAINGKDSLVELMKCALGPLGVLRNADQEEPASLIGFDVTGLPEIQAYIKKPMDGLKDASTVWGLLQQELLAVKEFTTRLRLPGAAGALSNLVFFSGSVSYAGFMGVPGKETCWDFVSNISKWLSALLDSKDWSYLLCRKEPPIYSHGWKPFSLYQPAQPLQTGKPAEVKQALGKPTPMGGFAATAGISDPSRANPDKVPLADLKNKTGDFEPYHPDVL